MIDESTPEIEIEQEEQVLDETEKDDSVAPVQYEITSYGADYDAEGVVKRLQRDDIFIPPFQRDYVWTQREASRFVESLLLGLPVPGVFLARESESKRQLVIDGQQHLKTLQFYFQGEFNPDPESNIMRIFKLRGVQPQFEGLAYEDLSENNRIILNDSIIHATIVKQDTPEGEQSSIYHIFERLNASGRKLSAQQIRIAIYHGKYIDMLRDLNGIDPWRTIFGRKSKTLKDQELILRFLALYKGIDGYKRPMKEFLNEFVESAMKTHRPSLAECRKLFESTIEYIFRSIGEKAFRPERAINAAVFDSVMVGVARRIATTPSLNLPEIRRGYKKLLSDTTYIGLISQSTSDEKNVKERILLATKVFK